MTDQEVLISTLREARRIIGEYTGPRNANQTLTQLVAVLDRQDVAHAIEGLEKGHEFRDVVNERPTCSGDDCMWGVHTWKATLHAAPIRCYHLPIAPE